MQGDPNRVLGLIRRADAAFQAGRMDEAGSFCRLALAANKKEFHALHLLGIIELAHARYAEADRLLAQAVKINPRSVEAHTNRGMALDRVGQPKLALSSYEKALSINPNFVTALNNIGNVLWRLKRSEEALAKLDKAIALQPNHSDALCNRGNVLCELRRYNEAVASYDRALIFSPRDALALHNRANALLQLKRSQEALASYEQALAIAPHDLLIRYDQGNALLELSRAEDALAAQAYIEKSLPSRPALCGGASHQHEKIRIAYLSADFRRHPTAYLTAELFELHDRNAFDVMGFSFGDDDQSEIRNRIMRSFDQFHDVRSRSDNEVARLLNELEIDIAVDLKGHTQNARCGILAYRPAPIQVSYLGFPGTTGAPFIDYVIADETVLPFDQQPFWTEQIVHLPNSYWVMDSKLRISTHTPDRRDVGLPESGFVFCCFNRSYKISSSGIRCLDAPPRFNRRQRAMAVRSQ